MFKAGDKVRIKAIKGSELEAVAEALDRCNMPMNTVFTVKKAYRYRDDKFINLLIDHSDEFIRAHYWNNRGDSFETCDYWVLKEGLELAQLIHVGGE